MCLLWPFFHCTAWSELMGRRLVAYRHVKLSLRHKRTRRHVRLSVVWTCVCQGRPSCIGGRSEMLHRNLSGGGGKNPGSTNKYTKFGQLIIRKIIKIIATRCRILRVKCTNSIFGVCPFVFLSVWFLDGVRNVDKQAHRTPNMLDTVVQ